MNGLSQTPSSTLSLKCTNRMLSPQARKSSGPIGIADLSARVHI